LKIFISHSSDDSAYGNALVDLLRGLGVKENEVIYTSNVAYGIPLGENIFNWLKKQIIEKPYVIYLLSSSYYSSVACLNEMGAAWIVENDHTIIFTPDFEINSPEFQGGALDPREIGFFINNEERLISFIELLRKSFEISNNPVLIHQKVRELLKIIATQKNQPQLRIDSKPTILESIDTPVLSPEKKIETKQSVDNIEQVKPNLKSSGYYTQFLADIDEGKLNNEELLLIYYILDTAKVKFGTGWQESSEIQYIREWEDIKGLNNNLSNNYGSVLRRFELRNYTEISALTGSGNPKEVSLIGVIQEKVLDFPKRLLAIIDETVKRNLTDNIPF
jgi:hypothetical protein